MAFIDHIRACNRHNPERFIRFWVDGVAVGKVTPAFAARVAELDDLLTLGDAGLKVCANSDSIEDRSAAFAQTLRYLVERGVLSHLHGEQYIATPSGREQGVLLVDRAAVPYFGLRAFGQHINGFVRSGDQLSMWIGRRAADRKNFPGYLDNVVAGGLPFGVSLETNLAKECWEEASIPVALARKARPVGTVSYCMDVAKGCKLDTLYCYDIELSGDFVPECTDGEVESFHLLPVEEVLEIVRDTDQFKLNCNLVIIDFLIRHGYIGPEEADYLDLVTGLHQPLPPF